MRVTRTGPRAFSVEFESEEELQEEYRTNLSMGGLRLPFGEPLAVFSSLSVTLHGPGGQAVVRGTVVAPLPDGVALSIEGDTAALLEKLLAAPPEHAVEVGGAAEKDQSLWDRLRALSRTEKLLLAAKAERTERAVLVQDNDPQVLFSLLKNPRITVDEVARVAKSAFLIYQLAELIMKTSQWISNLDVRLALVHNPK